MDYVQIIGILAGVITTGCSLPQIIKIIKTKSTKDISFLMYFMLVVGLFLWIVYAILQGDLPLLGANIVGLTFTLIVFAAKIKYG